MPTGRADDLPVSSAGGSPEIPTLLDDKVLANLHEDFASTNDLPELASLIRGFVERGADQVAAAADAVARGDAEAVRQTAHKLKGASRTMGASLTGDVAAKVEEAGARDDLGAARAAVHELEVVFSITRSALADALDVLEGGGGLGSAEIRPARTGLRAVLADDEPVALAVLRAAVERLGHECVAVTDGQAAIAACERLRPHIVITDLQMPGIDGVELSHRIRDRWDASVYLVVLSASDDRGVPALDETADARLSKPFREDELRAVLALAAQRSA